MPTPQQLYQALQRADQAGDTEAAKAIARALAGQVQDVHQQALESAGFDQQGNLRDKVAPTGSDWENFGTGIAAGGRGIAAGLAQYATDPLAMMGPAGMGLSAVRDLGRMTGLVDQPKGAVQDMVDRVKREDAPVMSTKAGIGGNVVANLAAMLAMGGGARAAGAKDVAAAIMSPKTYGQAAAAGAGMGALQPVASDDLLGRTGNTALGGAAGVVGQALPRAAGAALSGLKSIFEPLTQGGQERIAARTLAEFAADPNAIAAAEQSAVPGAQRTLAEATRDPGIAQLERALQNSDTTFASQLAAQRAGNNAARLTALGGIAGDDAAVAAAEAARKGASGPLLATANKAVGVETKRVVGLIDNILKSPAGKRDAVASALQSVKNKLVTDNGVVDDVATLYGVRQHIGDLLSGKLAGDTGAAKLASRELLTVRSALDHQIGKVSPEFRQYLSAFQAGSKPINQMQVGQEISRRVVGMEDQLGNPVLSPAKFSQALRNGDQVAQSATGFGKATMEGTMTPEQLATLGNIGGDLQRQAFAQSAARGVGSPTAQNLAAQNVLRQTLGPLGVPAGIMDHPAFNGLAKALQTAYKVFGGDPEALRAALLDPKQAARIMSYMPKPQAQQLQALIATYGGTQAATASALSAPRAIGAPGR